MKNKKFLSGFMAVGLILAFFAGCGSNSKQNTAKTDEVKDSAGVNDIVVWGEVKYNDEYQINIDFPARVESVRVKVGDTVSKGSTLILLSNNDYQANLKKLQLQANTSKASLNNEDQAALEADIATLQKQVAYKTVELQNGSKPDLQLLQNSLTRAQKEVNDAQNDVNKYQKLLNQGVISQSDFDKYTDVLNLKQKAKSDILNNIAKTKRSLQEELDALNSSLKYKEVQLNQQKNASASAQIDLDVMSSKQKKPFLSGNNIISNLDYGIVQEIDVVNGSAIGTQYAAQKVIDLIDGNSIYVSAEVPEEFIQQISQSSKVYIIPTANKNLKIAGQITRIANEAVEKDGDRIVKVQVKPDDKNHVLKPGYTADVQIDKTGK